LEFIQRIDICIKTHAKASPEYTTLINTNLPPKGFNYYKTLFMM
jgi:hypothetical protein